ncbi:probable cytochrome P450 12a5, mitochondrial [Littorina saxatilis]|uniref:probable cytochrome P450 12a5, mitochondrial n=1 Tax=Littorina saxatilis TaxID=31220 RepID=UPI0038B44660
MSRTVLEKLCHEILRARASQQLSVVGTRHKASSVTAVKEASVTEAWNNDVTANKDTSACPMTSSHQAAPRHNSRPTTVSRSHSVPRRSAHFSVVESTATAEQHVPITVSSDKTSSDTESAQFQTTAPPHLAFDTAKPFVDMPAPFSLPIIGTMWMHLPGGPLHGLSFEGKTTRLQELYGPIVREHVMLGFKMVHLYRPRDMETVYRAEGTRPRRDAFRTLKKYNEDFSNGVQGILTSQGDAWHRLRSKAQVKMMKPKSASAYLDLHSKISDDFVAAIDRARDEDGVVQDLLPDLYKFAMEGIGGVCFNRRLGAMEENIPADSDTFRFIEAVSDVMEVTHSEMNKIFLSKNSPEFKKMVRAQTFIRKLSIQEAERTLEMFSQNEQDVDGESGDLIPYLMTKTSLTEEEVMTLISEFFFAGVDTTSHLLGFALYAMAVNPEAQEKLIEEINSIVDGSDVITASTLGRMSYLKAFTKETFRMTPITPGNGRTLDTDIVLSGFHIPAGVMLALHHDWAGKSPLHVKDPDVFMPERWLRGNKSAEADIHPFILMPFGFGPRSCVGRRFAEQEYSVGLIKILQKYRVEYAHNESLSYEMCIVNKPTTPLKFRFLPRQ